MSDIHGEIARYHAMLKLVDFSAHDTLYIIGDVIDRHPAGVTLLKEIMETPNVIMLLGNHEQMCLDSLGARNVVSSRALWKQNGGGCTYRELIYRCDQSDRRRILDFLSQLPDSLDIEVNGRYFHLVHGLPSLSQDGRLWDRITPRTGALKEGATVIVGHTPTCFLTNNFSDPFRIWHGNGVICIDCGCGNTSPNRRLGCLRLEDMEEFYV